MLWSKTYYDGIYAVTSSFQDLKLFIIFIECYYHRLTIIRFIGFFVCNINRNTVKCGSIFSFSKKNYPRMLDRNIMLAHYIIFLSHSQLRILCLLGFNCI